MRSPASSEMLQSIDVPKKAKKKMLNKQLKFLLRLSCTVILLVILLRSVSWMEVLQRLRYLDVGTVLVAVIVGAFGVIISSYQWQCLLDAERIRVDLRRLVNLYLVGIAFNHFLPTGMGGDVVKAYYVGRDSKNTAGSVSAVMMSRITGFFGMLLISLPALILEPTLFSQHISTLYLLACAGMCGALFVAFLAVSFLPRVLPGTWVKNRLVAPVLKVGVALRLSARRPGAMIGAIVFGVLYHIGYALNHYAYATVLGIHVPLTFYLLAIPFVSLVAFLPFSINGFGLRESAFVYIFATAHVPLESAVLLVLLMDVQVLFFGMIGGAIYLISGDRKERMIEAKENTSS